MSARSNVTSFFVSLYSIFNTTTMSNENKIPQLVESGVAFSHSGLVHRVLEPPGAGPHPTVVMLHGRSGTEDVMWVFARTLPQDWLLVAPRAIREDPAGGFSWHPRQQDEWPSLALFDPAVTAVVTFLNALPELYNAHPDRLYLMGFSQGAATAYATVFQYPEVAQAIAGLVGFVPSESEAVVRKRPLAQLPVYLAVGRQDERIPLSKSRQAADLLRQAGADVAYHEYNTGHRLNSQGMRDLEAWWQERKDG
jgi:phospholipase/carboxylesterase